MKFTKNNDSLSPERVQPSSQVNRPGWVLPSGKRLEHFAMEGGFLGSLLLKIGTKQPLRNSIGKRSS